MNKKTFRFGALLTVLTAVVVAAIIVVNLIATVLVDRYNWRFDLTNDRIFTMTETTKNYLSTLETGVDIFVTLDEIYFTQSSESSAKIVKYLLDQYELNSNGNVSVTYDSELVNDAEFIGKFPYLSLSAGTVVVVSREQPDTETITNYRRFSLDDCFTTTEYNDVTYDICKLENSLTTAIMYLNQEGSTKVYLTRGHDEGDLSDEANSLIKSNIYTLYSVDLAEVAAEESPAETLADIDVLLIYYPRRDFSEEELNMLDVYLENREALGKGLMVFYDVTSVHLPNLEEFLAEWGVSVNDGVVYDKEHNYVGNYMAPKVMISSEANDNSFISDELYTAVSSGKLNICAPYARPLTVREGYSTEEGGKFGITASKVLMSYSTSAVVSGSTVEPSDEDESGMFTVATLSEKKRIVNNQSVTSDVFVCGTSMLVDETILTDSIFANDQLFVELLNILAHRQTGVVVSAVNVTESTLNATTTQRNVLLWTFVVVLPLLALAAAVTVYIRRRHL